MQPTPNPDKPRLIFCGDPHGDFAQILLAAELYPTTPIILLGDMECSNPLSIELEPILNRIYWIPGNHDTDTPALLDHTLGDPRMASTNLDGKIITLPSGIRIAGLGGVFRTQVWHPDLRGEPNHKDRKSLFHRTPNKDRFRGGVPLRHRSTIYPAVIDKLASMHADILVTHEAPGYHPHGFSILDTLAQAMGVKVTVHGHHHDHIDSKARWASQGFASFGIGLRGVSLIDLDGNEKVLIEGEQDGARNYRTVEY